MTHRSETVRVVRVLEAAAYLAPIKKHIEEIRDNPEIFREAVRTRTYDDFAEITRESGTELTPELYDFLQDFIAVFTIPGQAGACLNAINAYEKICGLA